MTPEFPNLYLPIEVKNRELYAKILLAKYAAEKGFTVVVGRKNDLNRIMPQMPPGIYLGLGLPLNYNELYQEFNKQGHAVVVCEEEGLITYTDDMYMDMRISTATLKHVNLLFSWGQENKDLIASRLPEAAHKIKVTGHPRFDLLKPAYAPIYEKEFAAIGNKYTDFILVCTCFPSCNHFLSDIDYLQSLKDKKVLRTPDAVDNFQRYQGVKKKTLASFLKAIPLLAQKFPDMDIVVRPHPSENKAIYEEMARVHPNIHVESNRFSVHPWIMSAKALVHHYCATAIEAYAAGVPRFALRPQADPLSEKEVPFACSTICESPSQLIHALDTQFRTAPSQEKDTQLRPHYIGHVRNIGEEVSAQLTVDALAEHASEKGPWHSNRGHRLKESAAHLYFSIRDFAARTLKPNRKWEYYTKHKFDDLSPTEIQGILDDFTPPSEKACSCRKRGKDLIEITA